MKITEKEVLQALSKVQDPDLKKDLVTLGMIENIKITAEELSLSVVLTTPACPLKEVIKKDCLAALEPIANGLNINIDMTSNVTSVRSKSLIMPNVKNIIAVASGKGGVGKSTVTANLAVALAKTGASVGIIDADIFGPSIPTMFDCEHEQPNMVEENGKNMLIPIEKYGVKLLSIGFLTPKDNAIIWRGPMASSALKQFISDVKWGELDYLLIDLPPGTSDIHLTLVQSVPVTGAVIVTTPQKVAIADAQKGLSMFRQPQINVPLLGVIENMAYFTPEELPENKYYLFGQDGGKKMAEKYDIPFLGEIPLVQSIRESGDSGYPAVMKDGVTEEAFSELAQNVARRVAIRNASKEKTKIVQMN
ncbi:Mrp/NBP35 family ATP-binding protein [Reichenbachiella carrageenanivorans]|uniref:Iron-sulfur cluster carrier protein n=1 Tax=Reichenbachiella carrageenanivorans TaxID=2979869 RepID=A0ABY6CXW7_9BACT|nr:Mrp/NBP35 family ATP-binding protein [Reichenbachiella carrageenanivorans]UXX78762.1 Mrp/NBP35 family ATP-binding protein [Reichenbachiella carrageenanivorans]